MAPRILLVEDDEAIVELLSYNLAAAGYSVLAVNSGLDVARAIPEFQPDLVILDWMLPGRSGLELCSWLRSEPQTRDLAVIMLTARHDPRDKLAGLAAGADDYVVKPFSVAELIARVASVLRRASPTRKEGRLRHGDLEMDADRHHVTHKGEDIILGPTEFRLFKELIEKRGRVLSREHLIKTVWLGTDDVNHRTVDVHVGNLRRALEQAGVPDIIRTVRGEGYTIDG